MTLEEILDKVQERLHDDGTLWSRTELLEWADDGYSDLLARSRAVVRPYQYDLPPRTAFGGTFEHEDFVGGTFQKFTHRARLHQTSYEWEIEHLEGITPTDSYPAVTNLWETAYTTDTNRHFRFIVGKAHNEPLRVYWDDKQLTGTTDKDLDLRDTRWWVENGQPIAWLKGTGRDQSFEIFEATTDYSQAYHFQDLTAGIPRQFSGSRTYSDSNGLDSWDYAYTGGGDYHVAGLGRRLSSEGDNYFYLFAWEEDLDDSTASSVFTHSWEALASGLTQVLLPAGLARYITSTDRQYLAAPYDGSDYTPVGTPRDFKSSGDSITLWEVIVPSRNLTETDEPALLPRRMHKYLKFYVLAQAFARKGEGQKQDLAQHYAALYEVGVRLLTDLGNLTFIDRTYQREEAVAIGRGRPPRPRLPSTYPQPRI